MRSVQQGMLAGGLAGLLLSGLLFLDEGPGNQLASVAQTLGFSGGSGSRWLIAGLVLGVGTLIGGGFGTLLQHKPTSRLRTRLVALAFGAGLWVLVLAVGSVTWHLPFALYPLLLSLVLCLLYGLVLGSAFTTLQKEKPEIS
jgi:hypothetical protein